LSHDGRAPRTVSIDLGDVWFLQTPAIDIDVSLPDLYRFARQADDPLDVFLLRVGRGVEDDDIPSLWRVEPVRQFVDHQILAIVKIGFHAGLDDAEVPKAQAD